MEKQKNIEQQLTRAILESMKSKNMTVQRLSQATGVTENFLDNLIEEKYEKFPPAPYVRGYLIKIAKQLDLDGSQLWENYLKNSNIIRRSGERDKPPKNKFASSTKGGGILAIIIVLVILATIGAIRAGWFHSEPDIFLVNLSQGITITNSSFFTIEGSTSTGSRLAINNEKVYTDENGRFEKEVSLLPGLNIIEFEIKKFPGQTVSLTRQVYYEENEEEEREKEESLPEIEVLEATEEFEF